jgi:hypothetical protein
MNRPHLHNVTSRDSGKCTANTRADFDQTSSRIAESISIDFGSAIRGSHEIAIHEMAHNIRSRVIELLLADDQVFSIDALGLKNRFEIQTKRLRDLERRHLLLINVEEVVSLSEWIDGNPLSSCQCQH